MRAVLLLVLLAALGAAPAAAAHSALPTYTGAIEVEHADDFVHGTARDDVRLRTGDELLRLPGRSLSHLAGRRVTLAGVRSGDALLQPEVIRVGEEDEGQTPGYPSNPPDVGDRRVAVILVSTLEDLGRRWDPGPTQEVLFGEGDSVASYFATASGGKTTLSGDVHGWYTIGSYGGCDTDLILFQALAAARASGVDFEDYHHVSFMFPRQDDCGFNGLGYVDGPWTWINGEQRDMRLVTHELGHNFGMQHAAAAHCTQDGAPVALSATCEFEEYGDPLDVMGRSPSNLFHAARRAQVGWLTPAQSVVADRDGVYVLKSVNAPGDGVKELLVPYPVERPGQTPGPDSTREYFSLELRTPLGSFDAFGPDDPAVAGVSVRLSAGRESAVYSQHLDLTPGSPGGHRDGSLAVGRSFRDPQTGATFALESLIGGVARVRVGPAPQAGTAPDAPEPTSTPAPEPTPTPGPARTDPAPPATQEPPAVAPSGVDRAPLRLGVRRSGRRGLFVRVRGGGSRIRVVVRLDGRALRTAAGRRLGLRLPPRALRGRHRLVVAADDQTGARTSVRLQLERGRIRPA